MTIREENNLHEDKLQEIASKASKKAVSDTHKNGLPVTIMEGNEIIKLYPNGKKEVIRRVRGRYIDAEKLPTRLMP